MIFAGANGYLDSIPVNKVQDFERHVLSNLRSKHADLLTTIATDKALSDDTRGKLKSALDAIKQTYAA